MQLLGDRGDLDHLFIRIERVCVHAVFNSLEYHFTRKHRKILIRLCICNTKLIFIGKKSKIESCILIKVSNDFHLQFFFTSFVIKIQN